MGGWGGISRRRGGIIADVALRLVNQVRAAISRGSQKSTKQGSSDRQLGFSCRFFEGCWNVAARMMRSLSHRPLLSKQIVSGH